MAVNNMGTVQVILSARDSDLAEGFKKLGGHLSEAQKQAKEFQETIKHVAEVTGAMFLVDKAVEFVKDGLAEFVMSGIEAVANLHEQAEQFHITAEAAGALGYAAVTAGMSAEQLDKSMAHLQESVRGLRVETPEMVAEFAKLGLTADDLKGKKLDEIMGIVADRIRDIPDAAEKASVAVKLFGDAGRDGGSKILAMLDQGSAGFAKARESALALGVAVSDIDADKVYEASTAMKEVGEVIQGIKNQLAVALAPYITDVANRFVHLAEETHGFKDTIAELVPAIVEWGTWAYYTATEVAAAFEFAFSAIKVDIAEVKLDYAQVLQFMGKETQDTVEDLTWDFNVAVAKAGEASKNMAQAGMDAYYGKIEMQNKLLLASAEDNRSAIDIVNDQMAQDRWDAISKELAAEDALQKQATDAIVALSAEEVAEIKKNRDALVVGAPNEDPRVIYERDVLKYMKQGYDEASARRKADADQADRSFFEDPKSDPEVVRQVAIAREIQRVKDEEADANQARRDREAAAEQKDDDENKKRIDDGLDAYFKGVDEKAAADKTENRQKLQDYSQLMGNLDQINQFFGKKGQEAFWSNKAFQVAQATINAWMAYSNTLGGVSFSVAPEEKQVLAASQLALGMIAVANISSQQPAGSRATGGPVSPGSMYEVNEKGPELLTVGGRDYLMMGDQGGHVTANSGGPGGMAVAPVTVHIHNNSPAVSPRVQQSSNGDIQVILDAVDEHQAAGVSRGNSKTARALSQTYNLNRSPGGR